MTLPALAIFFVLECLRQGTIRGPSVFVFKSHQIIEAQEYQNVQILSLYTDWDRCFITCNIVILKENLHVNWISLFSNETGLK